MATGIKLARFRPAPTLSLPKAKMITLIPSVVSAECIDNTSYDSNRPWNAWVQPEKIPRMIRVSVFPFREHLLGQSLSPAVGRTVALMEDIGLFGVEDVTTSSDNGTAIEFFGLRFGLKIWKRPVSACLDKAPTCNIL